MNLSRSHEELGQSQVMTFQKQRLLESRLKPDRLNWIGKLLRSPIKTVKLNEVLRDNKKTTLSRDSHFPSSETQLLPEFILSIMNIRRRSWPGAEELKNAARFEKDVSFSLRKKVSVMKCWNVESCQSSLDDRTLALRLQWLFVHFPLHYLITETKERKSSFQRIYCFIFQNWYWFSSGLTDTPSLSSFFLMATKIINWNNDNRSRGIKRTYFSLSVCIRFHKHAR